MALISLQNISIAFGGAKILDSVSVQIEKGQRICLLGRNGSGKSTLMKIVSGEVTPDEGSIHYEPDTNIAYFSQAIPADLDGTVIEVILNKMGEKGKLMAEAMKDNHSTDDITLGKLHEKLTNLNAWSIIGDIEKITTRLALEKDWNYKELSGGQKRRVLLAAALACKPQLLIIDEPTNHLDVDTITWLEDSLLKFPGTVLFVTHDRALLRKLATRIIELDRGTLYDWSCNYETFLQRKQALLESEQKDWDRFDKKLAIEEVWIQRGIRARRTRNEGRVKALENMRFERSQRKELTGNASLKISDGSRSGQLVIEAKNISFRYDKEQIINDFSTFIRRGDKTGIVGPNGCGKTTLVKLLLKELNPFSGDVRHGTNIEVTYFDQLREQLDDTKSIIENVSPTGNTVNVNGKDKHIVAYMQDFLFTSEQLKSPITHLSGGERNRLLLAKLFTNPGNLLVFDEPTNDLDIETLELLENLLVEYKGSILLVSHDRTFLNNVATNTLVFTQNGTIKDCVGGYEEWVAINLNDKPDTSDIAKKAYKENKKSKEKTKLSFNEAKELKELPIAIETMETEVSQIQEKMADPEFYKDKDEVISSKAKLDELEAQLSIDYEKWEKLEELAEKYQQ